MDPAVVVSGIDTVSRIDERQLENAENHGGVFIDHLVDIVLLLDEWSDMSQVHNHCQSHRYVSHQLVLRVIPRKHDNRNKDNSPENEDHVIESRGDPRARFQIYVVMPIRFLNVLIAQELAVSHDYVGHVE